VSVLGYGNFQTADAAVFIDEDYELQRDAMKMMYEAGCNFFDTAE